MVGKIAEIIDSGIADEYKYLAEQLLNEYDYLDVVSASLKLFAGSEDEKRSMEIKLTEERPIVAKGYRGREGQDSNRRKPYVARSEGARRDRPSYKDGNREGYKDKRQRDGARPKKKYAGGDSIKTYSRRND